MTETVTIAEAATRLGVSRQKVWSLVREGVLQAYQNPLDKRQKLIPADALRELGTRSNPELHLPKTGSDDLRGEDMDDGLDSNVSPEFRSIGVGESDLAAVDVEDWLRDHWQPS